ncbi:MAG: ABC transporter substrate-binding protein [Betaproteobacteria bacterium]|nr:ABC transporter substrate-binding protein [Betaproteobacteria bacterium]
MAVTLIENFRAVFYAPFHAASALNAYQAEGLQVETKKSPAAERTLTSLGEGAGQVSWGGPLRIMAALEKAPKDRYVAFCEVVGKDPFFLVGRAPNPGFRIEGLAGMTLATVTEVPTPWICLRHDLRRAGIDPATVRQAPARTMAENAAALRAGEVDLIQVFEPYARSLILEGAGHVWYAAANRGVTSYTTLNTTRAFIERNPDTVLRMTRAMYRTLKWIAAHDGRDLAEAISACLPEIPVPVLAACCNEYKSLGLWNRTPVMSREGLEWLRDAMLGAGAIRTRFAYEDCVDMRFAEQAVREDPPSL